MSVKVQAELALIKENIKLNEEAGIITFEYPIIGDTSKLETGPDDAKFIEVSTEKKFLRE